MFADGWETHVVPLLQRDDDGLLEATTIMDELRRVHGNVSRTSTCGPCSAASATGGALHVPGREVLFEQEHLPRREAAIDFTGCTSLAGIRATHVDNEAR